MEALKHSVEELSHLCEAGQISSQEMQCRRDAAISFYLGLPVDPKLLLAMHRPFSRARRSLPTTPPPCCRTNAKHCRLSAVQLSDRQHAVAAASGHIPMGVPEVTEPCAARAETVAVAVAVDNTAEGAHHPRRSSRSSEDPSLPRKLEQQEQPASVTVQLGRLPVGATQAEVEGLLAGLPGLRSVRLVYRRDGFFSGKALAEFTDPAQASAARDHVVRSGATLNGHPIEVVLAKASGRLRSHSV